MKHIRQFIISLKSISIQSADAQSTAEYALIILGAATLATLFIAWVNDTNRIGRLFDSVIRAVDGLVT